jgi:hypothetical protein
MKLFKSTILAVLAFAATALTGCTDNDDYSIGNASPGAYFPTTNETTVKPLSSTTVYEVPVCRTSADAPATYTVSSNVNPATEGITVPSSVSFVGDALETTLPITYDPAVAGVGTPYDIVLTLDNASDYGNASQSMSFTITAPTQTVVWDGSVPEGTDADGNTYPAVKGTCTGTGNYLYDAVGIGDDPGLPIYKVYDPENPHSYELVIEHWGYNKPFTITVPDDRVRNEYGEVVVRVYPNDFGYDLVSDLVGADSGTYGTTYVADGQYYFKELGGKDVDYSTYSSFNPENGVISMAVVYYCTAGRVAFDYDYFNLDGYPDYTVTPTYKGLFTNTDDEKFVVGSFTAASDVASIKAALVKTTDSDEAAQYVLAGGDDVVDVTPGTDVTALFPVSASGSYLLTAVSYNAAGVAQQAGYALVELDFTSNSSDDDADWTTLGTGEFVDGWFLPLALKDPTTYTNYAIATTIRQSVSDPTSYQVVDPFNNSSAILVQAGLNECTKKRNLTFSVEPIGSDYFVTIRPQLCGFQNSSLSDNEFTICNYEGYLADQADAQGGEMNKEYVFSQLAEEATTYDADDMMVSINTCLFMLDGEPRSYNASNVSYIAFPETSAAARAKARAKAVAKPKLTGLRSTMAAAKAVKLKKQVKLGANLTSSLSTKKVYRNKAIK